MHRAFHLYLLIILEKIIFVNVVVTNSIKLVLVFSHYMLQLVGNDSHTIFRKRHKKIGRKPGGHMINL